MSLNLDKSTWKRVKFGDVAAASKEKVDPETGDVDRYVAGEHMDSDDLKIHRWGEVGDGYLGPAFHRRFHPGQVLYGSRRTYLRKVAVAEFSGVTANTTFVVETKDQGVLAQEFLPFIMTSVPFHAFSIGESKGSVNPYINWSDLAKYEFDLPPLDTQKRLADLLWAVERHRRSIANNLDSLRRAREIAVNCKVERLLEKSRIPFKDTWAHSPESGWSAPPVAGETGRYVLSLAALGPDGYRPGSLKNVDDSPEVRASELRKGDFLISRANTVETVGRVGIFNEARDDVSFPDTMMRLRLDDTVLPEFAAVVLSSQHGRAHMRRQAAGSATSMVKINRKTLGTFVFPLVHLDMQNALLDIVKQYDYAILLLNREFASFCDIQTAAQFDVFGG